MAQSNFFPSRPNLTPQIYAYSDPNYEGQLKVGYTAHDVRRSFAVCRLSLILRLSSRARRYAALIRALASLKKMLTLENKNKSKFILYFARLIVSLQLELKTIEL